MMNYKDMTFCPFYKDCKDAEKCHRPLTKEVLDDAEKWWSSFGEQAHSAPISRFTEKPKCHIKK